MSDDKANIVRRMRRQKLPFSVIGQRLGVTKRRAQELFHRTSPVGNPGRRAFRDTVDRDAAKMLAAVPPDDRDTTARQFGDPLKGRSALDRRTR